MATTEHAILGISLLGDREGKFGGHAFRAVNPVNGAELEPPFYSAEDQQIEEAATLAAAAWPVLASLGGKERGGFLRRIAAELTLMGEELVQRAHLETGLPVARLQGELKRTTGQLVLFAETVEEGSWGNIRIDEADSDRKPAPKPDLRSMLRPLGPVVVFGASNFPLAFSVAGGDTASALAGGNPVIVKAHPAHPGTSELAARAVRKAVRESGLPAGTFALLFDAGIDVGVKLAQHSAVKAIAFTGSTAGGQALMHLAANRPEPIPCYAEMGSSNPVFLLPGAMRERAVPLAQGLQTSFTLGSGQFCTKPGVVFIPESGSGTFVETLRASVEVKQHGMLTHGIAAKYGQAIQKRLNDKEAELIAGQYAIAEDGAAAGSATVFGISLEDFVSNPEMSDEVFGPTTLLVNYRSEDDLLKAARQMHGHLTATILGTEEDLASASDLVRLLETKVGRILFNGFPTGVEVCHAMVHGGPFPSTSDGRSTSVGTQAMFRFVRPVCFQDFPDAALPPELKRANPLGVMRLVNGELTRQSQG